jgi:DNA-binding XRE family transcriptional regulator
MVNAGLTSSHDAAADCWRNSMAEKKDHPPLLTPHMLKAARGLLDMDQAELADAVGVSRKTIAWTEISLSKRVDPRRRLTLEQIRKCMEDDLGIDFSFETKSHVEGVSLSRLGADKRAVRILAKEEKLAARRKSTK